jgi:hypothetical protein
MIGKSDELKASLPKKGKKGKEVPVTEETPPTDIPQAETPTTETPTETPSPIETPVEEKKP